VVKLEDVVKVDLQHIPDVFVISKQSVVFIEAVNDLSNISIHAKQKIDCIDSGRSKLETGHQQTVTQMFVLQVQLILP
jgi:hypothetical protein